MANFTQLKKTAIKLGMPVSLSSFLAKLAKHPDTMLPKEIEAIFENELRRPNRTELAQLVKILSQAAVDFPALGLVENQEAKVNAKRSTPSSKVANSESPHSSSSVHTETDDLEEQGAAQILEEPEDLRLENFDQVRLNFAPDTIPQALKITTGENSSIVSWNVEPNSNYVYVLTGSQSEMPNTPRSGDFSLLTKGQEVTVGHPFRYLKLFKFTAPQSKGQPIGAGQVLGDISEFVIEAYAQEVRIRWASDDPSSKVAIYKSKPNQNLPDNLTAEYKLDVPIDGLNLTDREVQPGQSFEYCAVLESLTPSGIVQASLGKRERVEIPGEVPLVENFRVVFDETHQKVNISYTRPSLPLAKVRVFQVPGVPSPTLRQVLADGEVLPFERLNQPDLETWLGKLIIENEMSSESTPNTLEIRDIPIRDPDKMGSVTYVAVSTLGANAKIGKLEVLHLVGGVGELALLDRFDYQLLRVEVPDGATLLRVYISQPGSTFQRAKESEARNAIVATEYRRFGGIIWGDSIPGLSEQNRLPITPMRIWVEGVAMYDGRPHSGAAKYIDYDGRIEISHKAASKMKDVEGKTRRLFAKKSEEPKGNVTSQVQIKINASSTVSEVGLTIRTVPVEQFYLEDSELTEHPQKMSINANSFGKRTLFVADGGQQPFSYNPQKSAYRIKGLSNPSHKIPMAIVDAEIEISRRALEALPAEQRTLSIAILGAKQSGKTTYLQALLNYFEQQFATKYATKLMPIDGNSSSATRLQELHDFVETGTLPEATASVSSQQPGSERDPRKPIQFEFGGRICPIRSIDIYDLAGEDMDSLQTMKQYSKQLAGADLIILLIDPTQDRALQQVLQGAVATPPRGTDPFDVLARLEEVVGNLEDRNTSQKFAVVLSKFDGVEVAANTHGSRIYGLLQKGLSLTRDVNTNSTFAYNRRDGLNLDREVKALISKLDGMTAFLKSVENSTVFEEKQFFVVSSLGHSTDATRMDKSGITSFRISDPILWAIES